MSKLTEADKKDFSEFMAGIFEKNAETITTEGKQGVTFDVMGFKNLLTDGNSTLKNEEAKAVIGHMGNNHTLSKIIISVHP